jgi:hypothetical protein
MSRIQVAGNGASPLSLGAQASLLERTLVEIPDREVIGQGAWHFTPMSSRSSRSVLRPKDSPGRKLAKGQRQRATPLEHQELHFASQITTNE